jgi:hypothetical protein
MLVSPELMRISLFVCLLGMAILAAFFLRGRSLPLPAYLGWGLLILLLPMLGPFMVILMKPGHQRS